MKLQDLLRHIADNVENGKDQLDGLISPPLANYRDVFTNSDAFSLAPRTHVVNGFTVPAPEVDALALDDVYFIGEPSSVDWHTEYTWYADNSDKRFLERGLVHLTKEAATANAKAMLGIGPILGGREMNHTRTIIAASGLSTKEIGKRTGILRSIIDGAYKGTGRDFTPQEVVKIERALGVTRV